jgi:hypothetical protein
MPEYTVTWEIEVDADSPQEAAEKAYQIHHRPDGTATAFDVHMRQTTGELYRPVFIDLDELAAAGELIGGRTLAELREEDH